MNPTRVLKHEFVEYIPSTVMEGTVYVSIPFATVVHKCCCGCGREVVTPISPTDWELTFDGRSISLYPSIGNWDYPCRSHYWIRYNRIEWAPSWTQEEIEAGRAADALAKAKYFRTNRPESPSSPTAPTAPDRESMTDDRREVEHPKETLWQKVRQRFFG
jgi:hypothetical protein